MRPLGLYLHIPFCKAKCIYCDFYSLPHSEEKMDAYTAALQRDLMRWADQAKGHTVDTIYFGGGTPSYLGPNRLCRLLDTVFQSYRVAPGAEITLEANPDSAQDISALRQLHDAGFDRLSLGMQSADDAELRRIGRVHTHAQTVRAVENARAAGFDNLSLDLIYGLPEQTMTRWQANLDAALALAPEHLSCYGLKVEEGTPLFARRERFTLPDDDAQADMYLSAVGLLARRGYEQYEISNFSKPGKESRHNLKYWMGREYVGFGPGAHSYFDGQRYAYPRDLAGYLAAGGLVAPVDVQPIPPIERAREYLLLRMRTRWGIEEWEYRRNFGLNFEPIARKLEFFERHQWIVQTDHRWHFTPQGYLLSNTLILDLLDAQSDTFQEQKYWKTLLGKPDNTSKP